METDYSWRIDEREGQEILREFSLGLSSYAKRMVNTRSGMNYAGTLAHKFVYNAPSFLEHIMAFGLSFLRASSLPSPPF